AVGPQVRMKIGITLWASERRAMPLLVNSRSAISKASSKLSPLAISCSRKYAFGVSAACILPIGLRLARLQSIVTSELPEQLVQRLAFAPGAHQCVKQPPHRAPATKQTASDRIVPAKQDKLSLRRLVQQINQTTPPWTSRGLASSFAIRAWWSCS